MSFDQLILTIICNAYTNIMKVLNNQFLRMNRTDISDVRFKVLGFKSIYSSHGSDKSQKWSLNAFVLLPFSNIVIMTACVSNYLDLRLW